jgi:hypothetical protein
MCDPLRPPPHRPPKIYRNASFSLIKACACPVLIPCPALRTIVWGGGCTASPDETGMPPSAATLTQQKRGESWQVSSRKSRQRVQSAS